MKLVLCRKCSDVFKMGDGKFKHCTCRASGGRYVDNLNAEMYGEYAIPIGLHNPQLVQAIKAQPEDGWGPEFKAWVIAKQCPTIKIVEKPKREKKLKIKKEPSDYCGDPNPCDI